MRLPRPSLRVPRIPLPSKTDVLEAAALLMIAGGVGWKTDVATGLIVGGLLLLAEAILPALFAGSRK